MRIVGGRFGGRPLRGPSSSATRPTTDRLREALFNVLAHAYDDAADGARVLDLFAGTGALGLEALSRGAKFVVFVEEASEPRGLIRANIEALGLGGITRIFRRDATKLGTAFASDAFDLVFCDPPYGHGLAEKALEGARDGGWLAPGALVLVEEAVQSGFTPPDGFTELERRRYDTTEVVFLRAPGGAAD
ncbi:16S rRNA (guanine(966)-N(2))-methyltransferase RsmD [Ancylobacter sp. Lp-2]|uniref:16S rRNA (guanine(966)-N(2))-methyltransferase RsmD n=1 Tax=Ancylobacter sp. Lp-2 TaxID=2881339 RepID=UPI001E2DD829|nr:16S rRNA (guanine(966)-N(2))-methyltransferase RsmD [Ancylobacter sp. Lp-2]MCB4767479.1 16S rRNA (guanine(966)-N(2))-methyltransferase RsmD [Ancylobacter sp. Lp-2]